MLSIPLLKQTIKTNVTIWSVLTIVMSALLLQFASIDATKGLLFMLFYGMMTMILPGIYVLISSNKLLAGQVDRGSMAYILSTPIRRGKVVLSQMFFSILSIFLMFVATTGLHIVLNSMTPISMATAGYPKIAGDITTEMILKINASAFVVCLAMGAICYMFSSIFNLSKYSLGFSGTIVGVSILANMLSMFGSLGVEALDNFKYLSLCSLYDYESILLGTNDWMPKLIVAFCIAVAAYIVGSVRFCKKDLPL